MKQKVAKIKSTLEIMPGTVYLLKTGKIWVPVTVECSVETGWQRGNVTIHSDGGGRGRVTVKQLGEHRPLQVGVHRVNDEWLFDNVFDGLAELTPEWIRAKTATLSSEIIVLQEEVKAKAQEISLLQKIAV